MDTAFKPSTRSHERSQTLYPERTIAAVTKRGLDLLICLVSLPLVLPVMLLIGLCIVLESRGPALFKQRRVGQHDRRFTLYKFRSMVSAADAGDHRAFMAQYIRGQVPRYHESYKPPMDDQITRVGRFLRRTSLDELPQIFNVLQGNMSLVGPRPNVEWEVAAYEDWHRERLLAKPGITGLAQVKGRSNITFDELVSYDIAYVRGHSVLLDVRILLETFKVVFKCDGAG